MSLSRFRIMQQPWVGISTGGAGIAAITWTSAHDMSALVRSGAEQSLLLTAFLTVALVIAQLLPIHIHQSTKVQMGSVVFYLMAVLLPPPLAAIAALAGTVGGELIVREQRGLLPSDIACQAGRWSLIVLLGSVLAHVPSSGASGQALTLLGVALVLFTGDIVTSPLLLIPVTGESAGTIIVTVLKEASLAEAAQYLVGMLGAIAAQTQLWSMVLLALPTAMLYATGKRNKELQTTTRTLLEHMADTVDLRDPYTGGHSRRVTQYTVGILEELGTQGPDVDLIVAAARVHDIGKIAMPDHVLLKEGKLTSEEWAIVKQHPDRGADLLMRYPDFKRGVEIVRHHHERWDGQGYPHGLREHAIPFGARVIAVADSYDAMTSDRPYRKGMTPDRAAEILREGRALQWDEAIVDAFLHSIADKLEQMPASMLNGNREGDRAVPATV